MKKPFTAGLKASLAAVLKAHNSTRQNGAVASAATQDKRADGLYAGFRDLKALGYRLASVSSLGGRHIRALTQLWEKRGLSPATLQNNLSIFRTLATWLGKAGMVEGPEKYFSSGAARRSTINRADKSWTAKGIDVTAKLEQVHAKDARVALQLELQRVFGLRSREAMQLQPHRADKGPYLAVNLGTKGGRDRVVPINTPEKRTLIERAKTFAHSKLSSTSDPQKTLAQVKNHYYSVLRACGITRKDGMTAHGLRHEYANNRYQQVSGKASPVRGGQQMDRQTDRVARLEVAEELGHSRESITTHYLGR